MQRGFTLIEMIFVVLISALLSIGGFKAFESLYIRSAKAKAITDLSLQSQVVLNQLGVLVYNRIPNSVIGYDGSSSCEPIQELSSPKVVLEWLGLADDAMLREEYDGFVDMNASAKPDLNTSNILNSLDSPDINLIFAGAFDDGTESIAACSGAFGWHGNDSDLSYDFSVSTANKIQFNPGDIPDVIYEKYYLSNGAYAVTRGEHVNHANFNSKCNRSDIDTNAADFDNTLFLFYNYYPYKTPSQTYCGDGGDGNVTVLAKDVSGFQASYINDAIRISIDMNRTIRGSSSVHVSKQKAVF
ncbi:MAG: type II secretion system protein [Campylobacterota bacterium]|nr:type II secretion system protein [Campylobacterota bacterium]